MAVIADFKTGEWEPVVMDVMTDSTTGISQADFSGLFAKVNPGEVLLYGDNDAMAEAKANLDRIREERLKRERRHSERKK